MQVTTTILKKYTLQRVKESSEMYYLSNEGIIRSPEDAAEIIGDAFDTDSMTKEHLLLASLNTKNVVEALHIVHVGSLNASIVHPREVFQLALLDNAASIVIAHNHPSGDPRPSQEDIHVTRRFKEAGNILGIDLLDHIILGEKNESDGTYKHTSMKEKGYL